jgi:hypothetical protein
LKEFHREQAEKMPMSARLAFESGIEEYETRLKWARASMAVYDPRNGDEPRKRG